MAENNQSAQGGGEGDNEQDELTPEQIEELNAKKKLASENAATRRKLRDAEKALQDRENELTTLKKQIEDGSATDQSLKSEAATLRREIDALRKENKERKEREAALEEKTRTKTIKSKLTEIVAKLNDPASAVELLEKKAVLADDDTVVFKVKDPDTGEMVEKEASLDVIKNHKLLSDIFYPPSGATGSGGRGGEPQVRKGAKSSVDLERALTDFSYYKENREAILAERRRLASGN